ncbi:MAG: amidohydrolase family protein [Acidobacteriota bacterium]
MSALPYPITDLHVHIGPWDELRPGARARLVEERADHAELAKLAADSKALLRHMDAEAVERVALIHYVAPEVMGFTNAANDWVARYAAAAPDRLIAFGSVNPRHSADPRRDVEALHASGIRGLKIHPPHQLFAANAYLAELPALAQVYEAAQALAMPVMVHTGTSVFPGARNRLADPMACDDVAVDFPELRLILAHAGRPLYCETAFFLTRRHPNVYLELSGIPPKHLLDYLPRLEQVADKTLWGTDWPDAGIPGMARNAQDFLALPLPPDAQRKILRDNARRLFP